MGDSVTHTARTVEIAARSDMPKTETFCPEAEDRRLLGRGTKVNFLGAVIKGTRAFYLILFSRLLGAELFGLYLLAFSIQEVVNKFASLGLDRGALYLTGFLKSHGRESEIRKAVEKILLTGIVSSGICAALLAAAAPWIAENLLHKPELASPLRTFCLGMPMVTATYIAVFALRPNLDFRYEVLVQSVCEPLLVLALGVLGITVFDFGVKGAVYAHNLGALGAFCLAVYFFRRVFRGKSDRPIEWRILWKNAFPLGANELLNQFKFRLDLIVVGRLLPLGQVGIYGAIVETASMLRKTRSVVDNVLTPMSQSLHIQGERKRLRENLSTAVRWVMMPALAVMGPMMIVPEAFLFFFGANFSEGTLGLTIFAVGQLAWVTLGMMENVLAYTGHAYVMLVNSIVLVVVNFALLLLFIPPWGISGAATATTLSFLGVTLWRILQGKKLLGVWPFHSTQLRPLLAFSIGLVAGMAAKLVIRPEAFPALFGTALVFLAAYGAALQVLRVKWPKKGFRESLSDG